MKDKAHPKAGRWDAVPIGKEMTAHQMAEIIGITRNSFCKRFSPSQRCKRPEGFRVIPINKRVYLYVREH